MKEDLITFETAKLAKEKGFNIPTRNFFANWEDGLIEDQTIFNCSDVGYPEFTNDGLEGFGNIILIPTQSLLQKWLREKHLVHIIIAIDEVGDYLPQIQEVSLPNKSTGYISVDYEGDYITYQEALEKGLQEALKLIPSI